MNLAPAEPGFSLFQAGHHSVFHEDTDIRRSIWGFFPNVLIVIIICIIKLLIAQSSWKSPSEASGLDLPAQVQHFFLSEPKSASTREQLLLSLL